MANINKLHKNNQIKTNMNYKRLSLLVFFGGIILLLAAMFIVPVGGMSEGHPNRDGNAFFFITAEVTTLIGLIMCTIHYISEEQKKEQR
jgi:hypothetical protein